MPFKAITIEDLDIYEKKAEEKYGQDFLDAKYQVDIKFNVADAIKKLEHHKD